MKNLFFTVLFILSMNSFSFAQNISISGQFGWAIPQGDSFVDINGEKMATMGLAMNADALYHFESMEQLGVGLTYNSSILFGISTSGSFDIGLYSLSLYGLKGYYEFTPNKVSPYISLSTGLSQFAIPEILDSSGNVVVESQTTYSFGIMPELGVKLGRFTISTSYFVPVKYSLTEQTAGTLQISLGYRYPFF